MAIRGIITIDLEKLSFFAQNNLSMFATVATL